MMHYALKTASSKAIQKKVEIEGDLIGNNTADKIVKITKNSPKNNLETENFEDERNT